MTHFPQSSPLLSLYTFTITLVLLSGPYASQKYAIDDSLNPSEGPPSILESLRALHKVGPLVPLSLCQNHIYWTQRPMMPPPDLYNHIQRREISLLRPFSRSHNITRVARLVSCNSDLYLSKLKDQHAKGPTPAACSTKHLDLRVSSLVSAFRQMSMSSGRIGLFRDLGTTSRAGYIFL